MAKAIEQLIAFGHSPIDVWNYTPRRINGYLSIALSRHRRILAEQLTIATLGARGEPKEIEKRLKELSNG